MIEQDTIRLLNQCNAGIKMGVAAIDRTLPSVRSDELRRLLEKCRSDHEVLGNETHRALNRFHDKDKEPSPMAKAMAKMKTNMKLSIEPGDATAADLMTDGCNMGVKSLSKYLNQYAAADEDAKDIAKRLIALESQTAVDLRDFL